jgi:hypothetical protein
MQTATIARSIAATLVCLAVGLFIGCVKEPQNNSLLSDTADPETAALILSGCPDLPKGNTVADMIRNPEDPADDRINLIMYHYGQALRKVAQNPDLLCYLEEAMIADQESEGVSLVKLASTNSQLYTALNAALRESIIGREFYPKGAEPGVESLAAQPDWDANRYLAGKMINQDYQYDPSVYFIKRPEACAKQLRPIILLAQEVNDCDDVAGWKGNDEIVMSEADVLSSADPVIFIAPGQGIYTINGVSMGAANEVIIPADELDSEVLPPAPGAAGEVRERTGPDVDVDLHQIKAGYRYETSDHSEISGMWYAYSVTNQNSIVSDFWEDFKKGEREIHKNDINISKEFTDDKDAFRVPDNIFDPGYARLAYAAYEHDWYASKKSIYTCSPNHTFGPRMKYSHEWYFMDCGYASLMFFLPNSTRDINNSKCHFVMKRVN